MSNLSPYLLSLSLLLGACSSEEGVGGDVDPIPQEEKIAVSFSNSIELETKADPGSTDPATEQVLAKDVQVIVYAYKQSEAGVPVSAPVVSRTYVSGGSEDGKGNGNLAVSGTDGIMYLAAGKYVFYALSVNENSDPPKLADNSNSETGELANATDYLYCATAVTTIASTPGVEHNVPLSFSRLSARIELKVVSEGGGANQATAATTPVIKLTPTNPTNSKITLGGVASAIITTGFPVAGKANTGMTVEGTLTEGFIAGYVLLPMAGSQTVAVTITFPSITFEGLAAQTNKLYELTITTPDGGFASGKQYNYRVNITGNDVSFKNLTVTDWTGGKNSNISDSDITEDF